MKNLVIFIFCCFGCGNIQGQEKQKTLSPIDPLASKETRLLFRNLVNLQGTMFGHQDDLDYGIHWKEVAERSDVKEVSGDYPAVFGWEIGTLNLDIPMSWIR